MTTILPTANLKNGTHINLLFRAPGWDRALSTQFAEWLAALSTEPVSPEAITAHVDELERRVAGKSFTSLSKEKGIPLRDFGAFPNVAKHFSYMRVRRPGLDLSFDVFNAGNELALGEEPGGLVLELFAVDGRTVTPMVEVAREALRRWPIAYVFGGGATFAAHFTLAYLRLKEKGEALHVRDFLWPLTFSREIQADDTTLSRLPVFRAEREDAGVWIWLFEDLSMGHNDKYTAAAKALGLRSLWEQDILYGNG